MTVTLAGAMCNIYGMFFLVLDLHQDMRYKGVVRKTKEEMPERFSNGMNSNFRKFLGNEF